MTIKILMSGVIITSISFLGCTKREVVQVSPRLYAIKSMNGSRNWSGKCEHYINNYTIDTNFSFALKPGSDSTVIAELPGRAEELPYYQTDEIAKTVQFGKSYVTANDDEYHISLTYYYSDNHIVFEEFYGHRNYYHMSMTGISNLVVESR